MSSPFSSSNSTRKVLIPVINKDTNKLELLPLVNPNITMYPYKYKYQDINHDKDLQNSITNFFLEKI